MTNVNNMVNFVNWINDIIFVQNVDYPEFNKSVLRTASKTKYYNGKNYRFRGSTIFKLCFYYYQKALNNNLTGVYQLNRKF